MTIDHPTRVLIVTDHAAPSVELSAAITDRARPGGVRFRLVVLNPARAEVHLLHPERHERAAEAELVLLDHMPELARAAGHPMIGSVSVRHDPMDAIEETIASEPVDEIMLAVPRHPVSTWLHQDLAHRLEHFGLPVTVTGPAASGPD